MAANKIDPQALSVEQSHRLIADVLNGQSDSRTHVSELAHPIINQQTDRYCRRFCHSNSAMYTCTLTPPRGSASPDKPMCEWANASYTWMLDDVSKDSRLKAYQGKNGANLHHYFIALVNSLPFYERWKNWRFGRRVHVPSYIEAMGKTAEKIFLALRNGDGIELIASNLNKPLPEVAKQAEAVLLELTQRKRLHLLDPPKMQSLTLHDSEDDGDDSESESQQQISDDQFSPEKLLESDQVKQVWEKLEPVEQFVLEALVIDEQGAEEVLMAIKALGISIKKNVEPENTNVQQLYYFKRKCLSKLADMLSEANV